MYTYLLLLLLGFGSNLASAFTQFFIRRLGRKGGAFMIILLRDVLGIPVWASGFVLAARGSPGFIFMPSVTLKIVAITLALSGALIIIASLISIGLKAVAPSGDDSLVSRGAYSVVRHPVHCGMFLEFLGLFLIWPSARLGTAFLVATAWIVLQSLSEEYDMKKRIPGYIEYMKRVPAFLPFAGRRH